IPACRHRSLTGTPASPCLRIETIWVSLNFDFFMEPPGWKDARKLYFWGVRDQGELTRSCPPWASSRGRFTDLTFRLFGSYPPFLQLGTPVLDSSSRPLPFGAPYGLRSVFCFIMFPHQPGRLRLFAVFCN